jgi:hypothetical protein
VPPAPDSVVAYAVLTWPEGREDVVIDRGAAAAAFTARPRLAVADCGTELESVTCAVNEKLPTCVGVPEIWPATDMARPAGKVPEAMDHL